MAELENACEVTTIAFATVVVTLGAVTVSALGVFWPASTLIGVVVSTPVNVWIPPAAPADVENDQA